MTLKPAIHVVLIISIIQGGLNTTGIDFFVTIIDEHLLAHDSPQRTPIARAGGRVEVLASLSQGRTAAAHCGLFTHKSVPVIFEPICMYILSNYLREVHANVILAYKTVVP